MDKSTIINALRAFIAQRPNLDPRNYGDDPSYRAEYRAILRDKHAAEALLRACEWRDGITAAHLIAATRAAWSGRLTIRDDGAIDYCTGQYWPTEYRRAVCAVLSSALWDYFRGDCGCKTGDDIRRTARRELGAAIARRWFC
jgi:hypothetical protein